jgi:hypothetical protein
VAASRPQALRAALLPAVLSQSNLVRISTQDDDVKIQDDDEVKITDD